MHSPLKIQSRRQFLKSSSGVALFIGVSGILPQLVSCKDQKELQDAINKQRLTAWVELSEDGHITIYNPAAEMGQGSMTSLPALFAEEMDADWYLVKVVFSPQESAIYGSDGWGPNGKVMLSAGSRITFGYYSIMRNAGAQARHILLHSVSKEWNVPITELSSDNGNVIHEKGNKSIAYGAIVPFLDIPEQLPEFSEDQLKNPDDYRLVGKDLERTDLPEKVNGKAQFAMDINLPGMVYGVLERGKVHGAKPVLKNEAEILAMKGIVKVVPFDYAIGVVAKTLSKALAAKKQLEIEWGKTLRVVLIPRKLMGPTKKLPDKTKRDRY